MPKEYFSIKRTTSLKTLKPGAKIHVIGVSGVAMAQMAIALAERGYRVSGSDKDFYEPMGSLLAASAVELKRGFDAGNVPPDADLVIIGNVVSYGHPEVSVVEERNLPYSLFPRILHEFLIDGRHSFVVSGTHGKTTTTALMASVLQRLKLDPSWFIGGAARDFPQSLHVGCGRFSTVEGDEYDSAFFAKVPKFSFYRPDTLIVTSVEFDHADIYPSLLEINAEFTKLVLSMPAEGTAVCCSDQENLFSLIAQWRKKAACRIVTYGSRDGDDWNLSDCKPAMHGQDVRVRFGAAGEISYNLSLAGEYNAKNSLAVLAACAAAGLEPEVVAPLFAAFGGVRRRQDLRFDRNGITVIEDFAHHPTAVRETLAAVRGAYPGRKLVAVFEPRSNTSRKKVFQSEYVRAFGAADKVILCDVPLRSGESGSDLIDVTSLAAEISAGGISAVACPDATSIEDLLLKSTTSGDVLLIMSNGSFGGLIDKLVPGLARR